MGGALPSLAARLMLTRIIIFAKAPVPGKAKTRLIPALGADGAAELAGRMLTDTCRTAAAVLLAETELCITPAPGHPEWENRLPPHARLTDQGDGDLGQKLARAAERAIKEGERAILIGTDCPQLTRRRLHDACWELDAHDAVIHPTFDGGYALLGLKSFDPSVFEGIGWSGPDVARQTIGRISALGWSLHLAETLRDIDEPEDLPHLPLRG